MSTVRLDGACGVVRLNQAGPAAVLRWSTL